MKEYTMEELVEWFQNEPETHRNRLWIPETHRPFYWDELRQSAYIESLLMGLPTAPIFVSEVKDGRCALVDGLQRFVTLTRFLKNQLILHQLQQLTLLNGFKFEDLPLSRQRRFQTREIRVVALTEKVDPAMRQIIFNRVNL